MSDPSQMKIRRWVITCLGLAGLVIATWLVWPPSEIDPRFVGSWRVGETSSLYKLVADGTFTYMSDVESVRWTQWRVRDGVFYNLHNYEGWAMVPAWIERVRKGRTRGDHTLKVVSVTPDALVMRESNGGEFTLSRVPDGFIPPKTRPGFQIDDDIVAAENVRWEKLRVRASDDLTPQREVEIPDGEGSGLQRGRSQRTLLESLREIEAKE